MVRVLSKRIKRGPYPRFILLDKRGYDLEWLEKRFLDHIRVLSFWIKRGYGLEWLEKRFLYNIRVLSFWIKRGYDLEGLEKRFLYHIRRVWRSSKFTPFLFFFPASKVGLPLMGDTAVQYTDCYLSSCQHDF